MVHLFRRCNGDGDRDRRRASPGEVRRENSPARRHSQRLIGAALLAAVALAPQSASAIWADIKSHKPLRHPIVLVHGATINGSHLTIGPFDLGDYFERIPEFLGAAGTPVKVVQLPTDATIEERASVLKNILETDPELKGQVVNVIGHSLGALDARWCISVLHTTKIVSLTSIGTPHLGTPLANWAVNQIDHNGLWYWLFRLFGYDMASRRFLRELTTENMKRFNEKVPDASDVRYFSARTKASFNQGTMSPLLWFPMHWLQGQKHYLSVNGDDGMVPYDSQLWGKEVTSSTELDHLAQMNHHELRFVEQHQDSLLMYQRIYENLEAEGY